MSNEITTQATAEEQTKSDNLPNTKNSASNDDKKSSQKKSLKTYNKKKRKKLIKTVAIIVIIVLVLLFIAFKVGLFDSVLNKDNGENNYLTTYELSETTAYRTITKVLTSTGTIEPNDQYTITALVSGEILTDHFNKGDSVVEDQLLYEIESDSLDSNVTRARNTLKTAKTSLSEAYEKLEKLNVDSDVSGTITEIYVEVGDEVNAGTLIADVTDSETMVLEVPFLDSDAASFKNGEAATVTFIDSPEVISGYISKIYPTTSVSSVGSVTRNVEISVKNPGGITPTTVGLAQIGDAVCTDGGSFSYNDEGKIYAETSGKVSRIYFDEGNRINKGNIIVKLESTSLENQIESLQISVENAETSLEDALDAYDNYNITSPISGTVISKNYKAGDTIGNSNNGGATLAVIYDMSALKFTMQIDELDIDSLEEGQEVIITSDSREGQEYAGIVTNVSIQGTTSSGTTAYPVEVTIENTEDEEKRIVSEDGTVNKTYKTGMTSVENTYKLQDKSISEGAEAYSYENGLIIKKVNYEGGYSLYLDDNKLNSYSENSYILSSTVYSFSDDFSTVTVEVRDESKMLRPGMNIDAEIIVEKRENIIAIPLTAVGRGNTVKVIKNTKDIIKESGETNGKQNDKDVKAEFTDMPNMGEGAEMPENMPAMPANAYGKAKSDAEYEEVSVTVGISDDEYVEITSGLEIGDIVIIENAVRTSSENEMFGMMGMNGGGMGGGMGGGPSGGMGGGPGGGGMGGGMPR